MPLPKRRKVVIEESVAKDAAGNRVTATIQNAEQEDAHKGVADDVNTKSQTLSTSSTAERRSRHTNRCEEQTLTVAVEEKGAAPTNPVPTIPVPSSVPIRSSTRVIRKTRRDFSPPESPVKKIVKEAKVTTPLTKAKRGWELWSTEDTDIFFEALFEYGKDFDAILNMLVQRGRKRGLPPELLKRKDQVRFLYYRTWHKIAKFITITKDIRKETQEIYGLINYGIFRKFKGLNEKTAVKLNELINKGYTTLRLKGKTKKLKTPICSALKKINGLLENKDQNPAHQLPERISVELFPRTNKSWSHVQSLSQNPRIKMNLMSDRTLGAVLEYLNRKWKAQRVRSLENLDQTEISGEVLTLFPSRNCKLHQAITMIPQSAPRLDLTLSNYKENFLNSPTGNKGKATTTVSEEIAKVATDNSSEGDGLNNNQSISPKAIRIGRKTIEILDDGRSVITETNLFIEDENAVFPDDLFCNRETAPSTAITDNNNKTTKGSNSESPKQSVATTPPGKSNCDDTDDSVPEKLQKLYESSKRGWCVDTGKTVTLAQLMLMCGKDKKLLLEYEWCPKTQFSDNLTYKLANILRRLAHLAATEFSDFSNTKSKSHSSKTAPCSMCGLAASRSKVQTANKAVNTRTKCFQTYQDEQSELVNVNPLDNMGGAMITQDMTVVSCSSQVLANQMPMASQNGVFRVPMAVPLRGCNTHQTRVSQAAVNQFIRPPEPKANFLIPRKRKKQRNKSIIIQRTLLPKTTKEQAFTIMSNLPTNQQQILANSGNTIPLTQGGIITQPFSPISLNSSLQTAQPSPTSLPIITGIHGNQSHLSVPVTEPVSIDTGQYDTPAISTSLSVSIQYENAVQDALTLDNPVSTSDIIPLLSPPVKDQAVTIHHVSPPNLSTLLDMSLPAPPNGADNSTAEKLLDIALVDSNSGFASFLDTPIKLSKSDSCLMTSILKTPSYSDRSNLSPPTSPNPTLIKLGFSLSDVHWSNGETQDISLSSFLTDTPTKKSSSSSNSFGPPQNLFSDHSQDSLVETSFQSMMNESSIDLVSKFAKLADHISGPHHDKT